MYRKNAWKKYQDKSRVMEFNEGYKAFISNNKSERLIIKESERQLKEKGFKEINEFASLKAGDKVIFVNKKKVIAAFVIGEKPLQDGLRILGAHVDSPRLDLKENPLYESKGFVLADTHYYGGVKKYQWVTIPLAIIGVVAKKDGSVIEINIGDHDDDPIVGVTDLLIHLAADQLQKPGNKVIEGENLDITLGNMPLDEDVKEPVKANVLRILKEKYDIEEEDFVSAELEILPAGKARDYGLDRSMVAGYGHDDKVCAYTSLEAFLDVDKPEYTSVLYLVDKEEIGSVGATGAESVFFENALAKLLSLKGSKDIFLDTRITLENTKMLSSDVSAGFDPLYAGVNDSKNAAYLGEGLVFNKYTGRGGKSGSNDASAEYYAWIRKTMDNSDIYWQSSELGKVDQGGGGTIAYIFANYNMNVIDAGIPVLNMHAPMEIVSKVDVYEAYLGYKAFLFGKD